MSSQEPETIELLLADLFFEDGFRPGLRLRDHRAVLGGGVDAEAAEAVALAVAGDLDEQQAERLLTDLMSRRERPADGDEPDAEEPDAEETASEEIVSAEPDFPVPAPEARHNVRRLERARRDVEAFATRNIYQAELRTVVLVIVDHMRREHCTAGEEAEFERWWAVLEIYRRVLAAPEMAAASARTVLPKVLGLDHDKLTEQRLEHALGRRKHAVARRKKKRRRRKKKKPRARKHCRGGPVCPP